MRHLLDKSERLKRKLQDKYLFLFLDYDGTLTPIVESPGKAAISEEAKSLLRSLSRGPDCKIAVISGRSLEDIRKQVGIRGIIYVGNHGLEIDGPKIRFKLPLQRGAKKILAQIKNELKVNLSAIEGVIIEDKGFSLSVHYRMVNNRDIQSVKKKVIDIARPYLTNKMIRLDAGKKVLEIKFPVKWDKGRAALWLLAREKFILEGGGIMPIYIGDDATDENAFRALKGRGITVFVGRSKDSYAEYYLKDTEEVLGFLKQIRNLKKNPYAKIDKGKRAV